MALYRHYSFDTFQCNRLKQKSTSGHFLKFDHWELARVNYYKFNKGKSTSL